MTTSVKIPDPVYELTNEIAEERDMSRKEVIRYLAQEAGYDV